MANLAPDVAPTQDPYYLNMSKSAEKPLADESGEYAYKGAAIAIEGGLKGADVTAKAYIQGGMEASLDPLVQERTRQLEGMAAVYKGAVADKSQSLLQPGGENTQNLPDDVRQLGPIIQGLADVRANGRLSNTDYIAKRDVVLKDWRARFPGYRDYIDQETERITGIPAANAYIKSLTEDINAASAAKDSYRTKLETKIQDNLDLFQGTGQGLIAAWRAKQVPDSVIEGILAKRQAQEYQFKYDEHQRTAITGNTTLLEKETARLFGTRANDLVSRSLEDTFTIAGIGEKKLSEFIKGLDDGSIKYNAVQAQELAEHLSIHMTSVRDQLRHEMFMQRDKLTTDKDGRLIPSGVKSSWMEDLGGAQNIGTHLDSALDPYTHIINMISQEKYGAAAHAKNYVERRGQDAQSYFITNPSTKDAMTAIMAIDHMAPNFSKEAFQYLVEHNLIPNFSKAISEFGAGFANPNAEAPGREVNTLSDITKKAIEQGTPEEVNKFISQLPKWIERKDIPDQMKYNMAVRTFAEKNRGVLNNFEKDYTDESGTYHVGRYSLYKTLTNPNKISEISRLDSVSPDNHYLRKSFENWNQDAFTTLARQSFLDLNDLRDKGAILHYDQDRHQFSVEFQTSAQQGRAYGVAGTIKTQQRKIEDHIGNLNKLLEGQVNVINGLNLGNPDMLVLQNLQSAGVDLANIKGLPKQIVDEMEKAKQEKLKAGGFEGAERRSNIGDLFPKTPAKGNRFISP